MIQTKHTLISSCIHGVAAVMVAGCGSVDDYAADEYRAGEAVVDENAAGESVDAVKLGSVFGGQGAVRFLVSRNGTGSACSGALIGRHVGVTAAHCFMRVLPADVLEATLDMAVEYTENGTVWRCVNGPSDGEGHCQNYAPTFMRRMGGDYEATRDFAVFVSRDAWRDFDDWRGIRINPLAGLDYTFYGAGANSSNGTGSGVMRTFMDKIDWAGSRHFVTDIEAGRARTCEGDSGGPFLQRPGLKYVVGVLSNSDGTAEDACGVTPVWPQTSKMRANSMLASHITFINDALDAHLPDIAHHRCERETGDFYWCAPPQDPTPDPNCKNRCYFGCDTSIISQETMIDASKVDECHADCDDRCGG